MLKVLDVLPVGAMLSVTLEGACEEIRNGSKLIDKDGNVIFVNYVAMTGYSNPFDIKKSTTILIASCDVEKGHELRVVQ